MAARPTSTADASTRHTAAVDAVGDHADRIVTLPSCSSRRAVRAPRHAQLVLDADHVRRRSIYSAVDARPRPARRPDRDVLAVPDPVASPPARGSRCASTPVVELPFPILLLVTGVLTGCSASSSASRRCGSAACTSRSITLMAAGAITLLLTVVKFPNGGSGFWGFDKSSPSGPDVAPSPVDRRRRHRLLPLHASSSSRSLFLARHLAHQGQARPGMGGDPPERGHRGRGRCQHDALQAVGVRAVGVRHRRRRRAPRRRRRAVSPSTSSRSRSRSSCSPSC